MEMDACVEMDQELAQALILDFVADLHQHQHQHQHQHRLHPREEVNVYLCLTCGSPVFKDDDEQDSDLTSPFCSDCFTLFHSRDSSYDNYVDFHRDDDSLVDDDDYDHEDHGGCVVSSMTLEGPALPSSIGFGFAIGSNAAMRTSGFPCTHCKFHGFERSCPLLGNAAMTAS